MAPYALSDSQGKQRSNTNWTNNNDAQLHPRDFNGRVKQQKPVHIRFKSREPEAQGNDRMRNERTPYQNPSQNDSNRLEDGRPVSQSNNNKRERSREQTPYQHMLDNRLDPSAQDRTKRTRHAAQDYADEAELQIKGASLRETNSHNLEDRLTNHTDKDELYNDSDDELNSLPRANKLHTREPNLSTTISDRKSSTPTHTEDRTNRSTVPGLIQRLGSKFFGSSAEVVDPDLSTPEAVSDGPLTVHEELHVTQAELGDLTRQLAESRELQKALQKDLDRVREERAQAQQELRNSLDELSQARIIIQRHETGKDDDQNNRTILMRECEETRAQLNSVKEEKRKLINRVSTLVKEKGDLNAEVKRLRGARGSPAPATKALALDEFDSAVDQVSEAFVKSQGPSSVDNINDTLDTMVSNTLETAAEIAKSYRSNAIPSTMVDTPVGSSTVEKSVLVSALMQPEIAEEHRELVLDALLHDNVTSELHSLFFTEEIATFCSPEMGILDRIYKQLKSKTPWRVSQKWRSLAVLGVSSLITSSCWEDRIVNLVTKMFYNIALAYRIPLSALETLQPRLKKELDALYRNAHELSIILKRDVLTVYLFVVLRPNDSSYDPLSAEGVWPEMGGKAGDAIIGGYGLGLCRQTGDGNVQIVGRPKVITDALLREVGLTQ